MRVSKRLPLLAVFGFALCWFFFPATANSVAQSSDEFVAERALGPQWKQLSRRSGMIFTATVLASNAPSAAKQIPKLQPAAIDHLAPAQIEIRFHVDEPIAGVQRGQIVTVHEWSIAASRHRPLAKGERILLFLYPPSRSGLTSPVGGSSGLFTLDSTGKTILTRTDSVALPTTQSPRTGQSAGAARVSVLQLERAIRAAKAEAERRTPSSLWPPADKRSCRRLAEDSPLF
jgi:hypothetical protein